ncbi:Ig-like domain-containing protein [Metabacillus sp. FJAT-52054]|uniref:Ig-like domain-containing protein n=1 Tax=Metabacillus sediminis TaxID=3117746 RepID=A0ABZ2NHF3_9BACI
MRMTNFGKWAAASILAASLLLPGSAQAAGESKSAFIVNLKQEYKTNYRNSTSVIHKEISRSLDKKLKRSALDESDQILEREPNDYTHNANGLPLGYYGVGTFSNLDIDAWKITVPRSGAIWVGITSGYNGVSGTDAVLVLTDGNEEPIYPAYMDEDRETGVIEFVFDLPAGEYFIHAFDYNNANDGGAYAVAADYLEVNADQTPPDRPRMNKVDDNDKAITGLAEPYSAVGVYVNGKYYASDYAAASGKFKVSIRPIKAGSRVEVFAMDESGNVSDPASAVVSDKTPPRLTVNKVRSTHTVISGKTEAGSRIELKRGDKVVGKGKVDSKGNYKIAIKKQKAGTTFDVVATDRAKNTKKVTIKVVKK